MAVFTNILPATKSQANRAYTWEPVEDAGDVPFAGVLTITDKRSHTRYLVEEFPADVGRGFCLRKAEGAGFYCCNVRGFASDTCDCKGYERHNDCKHLAALKDLVTEGQI